MDDSSREDPPQKKPRLLPRRGDGEIRLPNNAPLRQDRFHPFKHHTRRPDSTTTVFRPTWSQKPKAHSTHDQAPMLPPHYNAPAHQEVSHVPRYAEDYYRTNGVVGYQSSPGHHPETPRLVFYATDDAKHEKVQDSYPKFGSQNLHAGGSQEKPIDVASDTEGSDTEDSDTGPPVPPQSVPQKGVARYNKHPDSPKLGPAGERNLDYGDDHPHIPTAAQEEELAQNSKTDVIAQADKYTDQLQRPLRKYGSTPGARSRKESKILQRLDELEKQVQQLPILDGWVRELLKDNQMLKMQVRYMRQQMAHLPSGVPGQRR